MLSMNKKVKKYLQNKLNKYFLLTGNLLFGLLFALITKIYKYEKMERLRHLDGSFNSKHDGIHN